MREKEFITGKPYPPLEERISFAKPRVDAIEKLSKTKKRRVFRDRFFEYEWLQEHLADESITPERYWNDIIELLHDVAATTVEDIELYASKVHKKEMQKELKEDLE